MRCISTEQPKKGLSLNALSLAPNQAVALGSRNSQNLVRQTYLLQLELGPDARVGGRIKRGRNAAANGSGVHLGGLFQGVIRDGT
jgi:hypothetical protein